MQSMDQKYLLGFFIIGCSFIDIFQRYLTFYFDNFTQNFFRFLSGSLFLLLISFLFFRNDLKIIIYDKFQLKRIGLLATVVFLAQVLYVAGIARTCAVMGGLISILGFPLTVSLSALMFSEEKEVVKNKNFIIGSLLAICGIIGITLSKSNLTVEYSFGTIYLVMAVIVSSFVPIFVKKLLVSSHPVCVAGLNSGFMCLYFLFFSLLFGDLVKIMKVDLLTSIILLVSGAYGLFFGACLAFINIKKFGIIITKSAELLIPIFTGIFGYIFFKEYLTLPQILFAGSLIIGCFIILNNIKVSTPSL